MHFYSFNQSKSIQKYYTLQNENAGLGVAYISYNGGDDRFQMITDKRIFIYRLEASSGKVKRFIPVLENTMYNFVNCN